MGMEMGSSLIIVKIIETVSVPSIHEAVIRQWRRAVQRLVMLPALASSIRLASAVQDTAKMKPRSLALEPSSMQEPKVGWTGCLTGKPQSPRIGTQVLMHLQRRAGRPVRVTAVSPWLQGPPRVHERNRVRDILLREHLAQDFHHLCFGLLVGLAFGAPGELLRHGDEDDVGAREEALGAEGLEDGVVAAHVGVRVEEVLGVFGPEGLVELEEDLGVGGHCEAFDGFFLPFGQGRGEGDGVVLQYAQTEGADGVGGAHAGAVGTVDGHTGVGVADVGDVVVEEQASVVGLEEGRRHAVDDVAVAALVDDKVVFVAEAVHGEVLACDAEDKGTFEGRVGVFEVCVWWRLVVYTCV